MRTWADERFRELSPIQPSGQAIWFFLLTGPHTGPVPGLFRAGRAAMAEELDWGLEAFDEAFREVLNKGMAKADFKARLIWLPNALKHNKPESPNVVRSWRTELDLLPECDLKSEAMAHIREALQTIGNAYVSAFDEITKTLTEKPSPKPSAKPSLKPSPKTMPNQEQEQEQEKEKTPPAAVPPPPKPTATKRQPPASPSAPPAAAGKPSVGTRLPEDWQLPKPWGEWAAIEQPTWTADHIRKIAAGFRDHWVSKPGPDARKLDWEATWRNWVRREKPLGNPVSVLRPEKFDPIAYVNRNRIRRDHEQDPLSTIIDVYPESMD